MMSGRAGCNEDVVCSTSKDIIDRRRCRANCRQRRIQTFRADIGVAVEFHHGRWRFLVRSGLRYAGAYGFQMFFRMRKKRCCLVGAWCVHTVKPIEIRPLQLAHQGPDTIRALGMAGRGQMFKIDRMPVKPCRHSFTITSHRHMTITAMRQLCLKRG